MPEQAFLDGVARGDIWWHALPFNAELELMDASLLAANVQLTHEIDAALGLPPKITMSQVWARHCVRPDLPDIGYWLETARSVTGQMHAGELDSCMGHMSVGDIPSSQQQTCIALIQVACGWSCISTCVCPCQPKPWVAVLLMVTAPCDTSSLNGAVRVSSPSRACCGVRRAPCGMSTAWSTACQLTQQGMLWWRAQRDVLGFSRSAVPILVGQGVQAVTVGTNGGCAPPAVPHNTPFIWRDARSRTQLLAMWHPGARLVLCPVCSSSAPITTSNRAQCNAAVSVPAASSAARHWGAPASVF